MMMMFPPDIYYKKSDTKFMNYGWTNDTTISPPPPPHHHQIYCVVSSLLFIFNRPQHSIIKRKPLCITYLNLVVKFSLNDELCDKNEIYIK